jgi:DNA-binding MarR family transcriptional regulator
MRKKKPSTEKYIARPSVDLTPKEYKIIKEISQEKGLSVSALIRMVLRDYLKTLEKEKGEEQ